MSARSHKQKIKLSCFCFLGDNSVPLSFDPSLHHPWYLNPHKTLLPHFMLFHFGHFSMLLCPLCSWIWWPQGNDSPRHVFILGMCFFFMLVFVFFCFVFCCLVCGYWSGSAAATDFGFLDTISFFTRFPFFADADCSQLRVLAFGVFDSSNQSNSIAGICSFLRFSSDMTCVSFVAWILEVLVLEFRIIVYCVEAKLANWLHSGEKGSAFLVEAIGYCWTTLEVPQLCVCFCGCFCCYYWTMSCR